MKRSGAALKTRLASLRLPNALIGVGGRHHLNAAIEVAFLAMMQSEFFWGKTYEIPPLVGQSCSTRTLNMQPSNKQPTFCDALSWRCCSALVVMSLVSVLKPGSFPHFGVNHAKG